VVGELGRIETCAPAVAFHDGGYTVPGPRLVADQLRGRLAAALESPPRAESLRASNKKRLAGLASPTPTRQDGGCCVQRAAVNTEPALTRSDLIASLAITHPHLRRADIELLVATIFDQITEALAHGGRVELRGFGAFKVKRRNVRIGHNPRTGELVSAPEKPTLFFKAGKGLHYRLNRRSRQPASAPPA
jgi:integration host factor subunit beta